MAPRALVFVAVGMGSVQFGAALAVTLFDEAGPAGTVLIRVGVAALLLALIWRPLLRGHSRDEWRLVIGFGASLAVMNFFFYESLDRIPLGLAVTFEFIGPLGVAIAGSRRRLDLAWVAFAAIGIVLIASPGTGDLDALGVLYALVAGAAWAAYILASARTGRALPGGMGLALAMCVAAAFLLPVGFGAAGDALLDAEVLLIGAGVAVLSSVIPYSAEFEALRLMPEHVFGIVMSLEPAIAALAGYLLLEQNLGARELVGIACVMAATAGAVAGTRAPIPRDA
ncbi:MAG: EamA family transporter [Thermoleophilaceae bacterium]